MSSRAIIARSIKNGYFTSWCWVNGDPENIGEILRTSFKSDEDVDELISYKSILGIFNDPADDNNKTIFGSYNQLKNGLYVKYDDGGTKVVSGGLNGFFPSLITMMKERVQHIYIFDDGTWITYNIEHNVSNYIEEKKSQFKNQAAKEPQESTDRKPEDVVSHRHNETLKTVRHLRNKRKSQIKKIINSDDDQ